MSVALTWFVLTCIICFLRKYCFDTPRFPNGKYEHLDMPSVRDLDSSASTYVVDEYVNSEIIPAAEYFNFEREFKDDSDSDVLYFILILYEFVALIFSIKNLYNYTLEMFFNKSSSFIAYIVPLCIVIISYLIWRLILKFLYKFLAVPEYTDSVEDLLQSFGTPPPHYPVSQKRYFKNYVISYYLGYYRLIANSVRRRLFLRSIVNVVSFIVYFLFFFRVPN